MEDKGESMTTQPYTLHTAIRPDEPHVGGPVELEIVLVNRSNATVHIGQRSVVFDWRYELIREDGSPVAMTRYGEEGRRSADGGPPGAVLLTLAPGEQLKAKIPLHEVFELIRPGRYRLVVSRTLPSPHTGAEIEVRSAPFQFTVRE
jgi:hypothetical protein